MITVGIFNIFVVYFAYLARHKREEFWLTVSFSFIFLFLALRYNYGNDYTNYLNIFIEVSRSETIDYLHNQWKLEPAWVFLCRLFEPLGFFTMTAALALFHCFVYCSFLKKYVPSAYYWLAVFIYVFTPSFMLINISAMRQSVAITLFVFSLDYIHQKDAIRYFLCICLASLFHMSAIIFLPLYLLGFYEFKINKIFIIIIFTFFVCLLVFRNFFVTKFNMFIDIGAYYKKYGEYQGISENELNFGLGLVLYLFLFLIVLLYDRYQAGKISLMSKIVILSNFIMPIALLMVMISRIDMYLQTATLSVYPYILTNIKTSFVRILVLMTLVLLVLYSFYNFFHAETWKKSFATYQTIFSAPEIY